jgi:hypothetical protein
VSFDIYRGGFIGRQDGLIFFSWNKLREGINISGRSDYENGSNVIHELNLLALWFFFAGINITLFVSHNKIANSRFSPTHTNISIVSNIQRESYSRQHGKTQHGLTAFRTGGGVGVGAQGSSQLRLTAGGGGYMQA